MRCLWVWALFLLMNCTRSAASEPAGAKCSLQERFVETQGAVSIAGEQISYTATAGNLVLQDALERDKGSVFFVAYHLNNPPAKSRRPIMFCTNGGPGSSAAWLHLGLLGPKRIVCDDKGAPLSPFQLVNNENSLLDVVDLVFVDPISTGFSRAAPGEDEQHFHGVDEDARYIGEFIRLYLSRFGGWESSLFFMGESYGTTRAAVLVSSLIEQQRIYLEKIVLISSALNFQTFAFGSGNDLPFITALPSYAAASWFYQKLPPAQQSKPLDQLIAEAEAFAFTDYNIALMKGDRLTQEEKKQIASSLVLHTGLGEEFLQKTDLRVTVNQFRQELLRAEDKTIGRFDCRYAGKSGNPSDCQPIYDPSFEAVLGPFNAAINEYLRKDLKWESTKNYELLASVWPWKYGKTDNRYLDASEPLRIGMLRNPRLKVFVASGKYDLAIPYLSTKYTFDHLGVVDRVSLKYYDAGHMIYLQAPVLKQLSSQLREFLAH